MFVADPTGTLAVEFGAVLGRWAKWPPLGILRA